jgi:hypothetical protein
MRAGTGQASNSSSATSKSSANRHRSGRRSGQEMTPTFNLPCSDITVMFSPQPWNSGPSVHRFRRRRVGFGATQL